MPTAAAETIILSIAPFSMTLVSPVTTGTPAISEYFPMLLVTLSSTSISNPSSRIMDMDSASGFPPMTAMSFTVPLTASDPMSPPGKKMGLTV